MRLSVCGLTLTDDGGREVGGCGTVVRMRARTGEKGCDGLEAKVRISIYARFVLSFDRRLDCGSDTLYRTAASASLDTVVAR